MDLRGGGKASLIFAITCFFTIVLKNYKIEFFKVELIINNAPLICVYPNTIKICLTPNNLLFDRQLLYSSSPTSSQETNLSVKHYFFIEEHFALYINNNKVK